MKETSLTDFIEALENDAELKAKVLRAEADAARSIREHTDAITALAAEAGFDVDGWHRRPVTQAPSPTEAELETSANTCCWVVTSTI